MAKFTTVRTQKTLPGASTAVRANIPTDTGAGLVGQAVASVGGVVSDLGTKFDLIQARSQLSDSTVAASDIVNAFFLKLQGNNDPETYGESMEKLFTDIDTLAPKNAKAAALYNQNMATRKLAIARKTREAAQDKVISNAQSADFLLLQKAKETGDFTPYKASVINGVKLGVYTAKDGEALLDDADKEVTASKQNAAISDAFTVWQETGDLKEAFRSIQEDDRISAEDKQEMETELKTRVTNRKAEDREALEAVQEQQLADINQMVFADKNYTDATNAVLASDLDEKAKTSLLTTIEGRAAATAAGKKIQNDRVVENELYEMSLDIWRGNVTKKQFDDAMVEKAGKLDDEAFKRVTASAANTLKTSQAQALARADEEAANVLVDFKSEDAFAKFISDSIAGLAPDIADAFKNDANEKRQLQFNNLAQYNAEVRQWVADNPDKTGKEFFQFKEGLKHEYWNKNLDDLRALRAKQNVDAELVEGPPAPTPEDLQPKGITATNPETGEKVITFDGGETWQPIQ